MAQNRFGEGMRIALSRALAACADETHGRFVESGPVAVKGTLPTMRGAFEIRGTLMQEQADHVVIKLPGPWGVTYILSRADFTIRPVDE